MSATLVLLLSCDLDRSANMPSARISWGRTPLLSLVLVAVSSDRLRLFLGRGLLLRDNPLLLDLLLSHLNLPSQRSKADVSSTRKLRMQP